MKKIKRLITALTFLIFALLVLTVEQAAAQEPTSIAKDSLVVDIISHTPSSSNDNVRRWSPDVTFRINGPVDNDDLIHVEYNVPGSPALRFDCTRLAVAKGYNSEVTCSSRPIQDKASTYAGLVPFAIKMWSELKGTDEVTLFAGTMKIVKIPPPPNEPRGDFVYYINQDWRLPIAYVFYRPGSAGDWDRPTLHVAFWIRGGGDFIPYIFHKGQEVGGKADCSGDLRTETAHSVISGSENLYWQGMDCTFYTVAGWDRTESARNPSTFLLDSQPGEYEVKLLLNGRLSRVIKFTVGADGDISNGIAEANKINTNRVIVPIQILGNTDGKWNREAWKTEAFYGNPLKGFTAAP